MDHEKYARILRDQNKLRKPKAYDLLMAILNSPECRPNTYPFYIKENIINLIKHLAFVKIVLLTT